MTYNTIEEMEQQVDEAMSMSIMSMASEDVTEPQPLETTIMIYHYMHVDMRKMFEGKGYKVFYENKYAGGHQLYPMRITF